MSSSHRLLACASLLLGAAAVPQDPAEPLVQVRFERRATGFVVRLGRANAAPIVELSGVELTVPGANGAPKVRLLPFTTMRRSGRDSWHLETAAGFEHQLRVTIRPSQHPQSVHVTVEDDVGIRNGVLRIELPYRWLGGEPPEFVDTPYATPEPDDVAIDAMSPTPLLVAAGKPGSLGLLLDPRDLADNRRLPSYLRHRRDPNGSIVLAHGAGRFGVRAANRYTLSGARVTFVEEETLRFAHELWLGRGTHTFLAELANRAWEVARAPVELATTTLREALERSIAPVATDLAAVPGHPGLSYFKEPADSQPTSFLAHDANERPLATALSVFRWARAGGKDDLIEQARGIVRLFLTSPSSSGLFYSRVRINLKDGEYRWEPDEQQCLSSQDAARIALWLIRWSEADPNLAEPCLAKARELAGFVVRSQWKNGSIAGRFQSDTTPRVDELYDRNAETLTCGRALLAVWRHTGDETLLEGAKKALDAIDPWSPRLLDRDVLRSSTVANRVSAPLTARIPIDGALLAFALMDATGERRYLETAMHWTTRLLPLQQVWSPTFFSPRLRGGMFRGRHDGAWSELSLTEAAFVFARAWRATGNRVFLERAAGVIRSPLRTGACAWGMRGSDTPIRRRRFSGLASAAWWIHTFLDEYGDVVIDSRDGSAVAFERCRIADSKLENGRVSFRLQTSQELVEQGAVFRVRILPEGPGALQVVANGRDRGTFSTARLARGLHASGEPALDLRFRPPGMHDRRQDLEIRARLVGSFEPELVEATVEVRDAATLRLELPVAVRADSSGNTYLSAVVPATRFVDAETLFVQMRVRERERSATAPATPARIVLGDWSIADCGDDDERSLSVPGKSTVRPFPDGKGQGRFAPSGTHFTYAIPIASRALRARLRVRHTGSGELRVGRSQRIPLRRRRQAAFTETRLEFEDRSLWSEGRLVVEFHASDDDAGLAWIQFTRGGTGTPATAVGNRVLDDAKPATWRVHVLPVLTEPSASHDPEAIRLAFFGGPDHRTTPPPAPRPTAGSLASWFARLSRGKAKVAGWVERWLPIATRADKAQLETFVEDALAVHAVQVAKRKDVDLRVIVHSSAPDTWRGLIRPKGGPPILVVPATDEAGALLPLGEIARLALLARTDLPPADSPLGGHFDNLFLTGTIPATHTPPLPSGLRLNELRWVPVFEAEDRDHPSIELPRLADGGFVLALPFAGGDGRGRLLLEHKQPTRTSVGPIAAQDIDRVPRIAGVLPYWDFGSDAAVRFVDLRRNRRLAPRLAPIDDRGGPTFPRAHRARWLKASGTNVFTPHGERAWRVRNPTIGAEGTAFVDVDCLSLRLLAPASEPVVATKTTSDSGYVPLSIDAPKSSLGHVARDALQPSSRLVVTPPSGRGGRVRLTWSKWPSSNGVRVSGVAKGRGFSIHLGTMQGGVAETVFRARSRSERLAFATTIPAQRSDRVKLFVEVINDQGGPGKGVVLEELRLHELITPVVQPTELVAKSWIHPKLSAELTDGVHYSPTLVLDLPDRGEFDFPVSIPRTGAVLRIQAGLPKAAGPEIERPLTVVFRDSKRGSRFRLLDGERIRGGAATLPLWVIDLDELRGRTGFIEVRTRGNGAPIHLTQFSLRAH